MPRSKAFFVIDAEEKDIYMKARHCGIQMLVILVDALPLVFFGNDKKTPYLRVRDVITWYVNENKVCGKNEQRTKAIRSLRAVLRKFKRGEIQME